MNWDRMEGEWKQRRGRAMHHWGKVMNDDLAAIAGKSEEFVGRLQERYGIAREEADRQVEEFKRTIGQLKKSNDRLMRLQKSLHHKEGVRSKRVRSTYRLKKTTRSRPSK
jgi:uncharacterized protein YjbJ (UPF0337 family)